MSAVYRAVDRLENVTVAIKMLHPQMLLSPTNIKRFQQEAQTASDLSHPILIKVHHLGVTADGVPYIVMEHIEGVALSEVIKAEGRIRPERCLDIFLKACEGLSAAHEKGIVHRNIKSSNLMLIPTGDGGELVKVIDFGIAKLLPTEGEEAQRLTKTGKMIGSPIYMSPEQWRAQPQDARSDIYSMGCLMYEALTGNPPLVGASLFETMYKHLSEVPEGLGEAVPDAQLREQLEAILFKAMAKEPELRYQNMKELAGALEQVRAGTARGPLARLHSLWQTSRLKRPPRRPLSPLVIGLAIAVVILLALSAWALNGLFGDVADRYVEMSWVKNPEPLPPIPRNEKQEKFSGLIMSLAAAKYGDDSPELIKRLAEVGRFRKSYCQWSMAASAFEQALAIANRTHAPEDFDYNAMQVDLADCYYALGRFKDAEGLYHVALFDVIGQTSDRDYLRQIGRVGETCLRLGDLDKAQKYLSWAERIAPNSVSGPEGIDMATESVLRLSQLGDVHRLEGQMDEAAKKFSLAVDAWKQLEGDTPRKNLSICLYHLGEIQRRKGNAQDAARIYKQALDVAEGAFGSNHQYVANILYGYSDVLWEQSRFIESLKMRARANRIRRNA